MLIYHILLLGPIEKQIRLIIIAIIIFINIVFFNIKRKKSKNIAIFMMIVFIILNIFLSYSINKVYGIIDSINKNKTVYSSSLITMKSSNISNIEDIKKYKIGLINDNLSVDNYIIAKEIIDDKKLEKNNEIVSYDDMLVMLNDLYSNKIDLMFVSSNYDIMFKNTEGFENIDNEVKVIASKDKTIKKNSSNFSLVKNDEIKPFSILLMGVDSEKDGLKKNKDMGNFLFVMSIILSIISSIFLIKVIDGSNNGAAVGKYTYYVNGKKVSSASYAATQNFGIGFMFFILLFGSGIAISANIINKKNKTKVKSENKKPNIVALIFSILSSIFGSMLIVTSICTMANILQKNSETAPIIAIILGIFLLVIGIWGISVFIKRKKISKNQ